MATHEFLEHTSELELRVCAPTLAALIEEAGHAVGELLRTRLIGAESATTRVFKVNSCDREALLVDWLNEILFVAEAYRWAPIIFRVAECSDTMVRARGEGVTLLEAPALIKAATHHGLQVRDTKEGFQAQVILDI
jgi:SHS2 domain-containing protein